MSTCAFADLRPCHLATERVFQAASHTKESTEAGRYGLVGKGFAAQRKPENQASISTAHIRWNNGAHYTGLSPDSLSLTHTPWNEHSALNHRHNRHNSDKITTIKIIKFFLI